MPAAQVHLLAGHPRARLRQLVAEISEAMAQVLDAPMERLEVWVDEIDRCNIYHASLLAMQRAVEALAPQPDHVLVDARRIPGIAASQTSIVGGDGLDASIAAVL